MRMQRVCVERYPNPDDIGYAGLIEGVREDGTGWIMWLDDHGSPQVFYGARNEDGGVLGDPIILRRVVHETGFEPA